MDVAGALNYFSENSDADRRFVEVVEGHAVSHVQDGPVPRNGAGSDYDFVENWITYWMT
jgi:hypothetical protein